MKTSGKGTSELSDNIKKEISVPDRLSKWATFSEATRLTEMVENSKDAKQNILRASINRVR